MADFALWVTAAEASLGWPAGTFMAAYAGNRASANEVALEASIIAKPLLELLAEQGSWSGSASELLTILEERVGEHVKRQHGWPKNPRSMSGHLNRLSPNLRAAGWDVDHGRTVEEKGVVHRACVTSSVIRRRAFADARRCQVVRLVPR